MNERRIPNDLFRQARERLRSPSGAPRPISRQELAEAVNAHLWQQHDIRESLDEHDIGRIERGETRWPGKWRRAGLRAVLGANSDADLGIYFHRTNPRSPDQRTPVDVTEPASGPLDQALAGPAAPVPVPTESAADAAAPSGLMDRLELRRQRLFHVISADAVDRVSVDQWEETVHRHGCATRSHPPRQMLQELDTDLEELVRALAGRQNLSTLRPLTCITAQMAGLMFLTLIKLDEPVRARAWARTARMAADEAGSPALLSWVLAQEAYVCFYAGRLVEAVEVASHAQAVAHRRASAGVALAAALEARASAALGRPGRARAALQSAEDTLDRLDPEDLVASAFGYNEAQLRFHEGNTLTYLGDVKAAERAHERALQLYPAEDFLDRTLVLLDQASCLVVAGDARAGVAHATCAISDLDDQQRDGLVTRRARQLLESLSSQQAALKPALELRDLLARCH
jgi:tetratricopeptide (TPR) repeat protein